MEWLESNELAKQLDDAVAKRAKTGVSRAIMEAAANFVHAWTQFAPSRARFAPDGFRIDRQVVNTAAIPNHG